MHETIEAMKKIAVMLIPYSYPHVKDDNDVSFLKQRELVIDGYTLIVMFSRADYGGVYFDMVCIAGKYMPFLPMTLLCKIAKRFLGDKKLTFSEMLKDNKKSYTWLVLHDQNGTPIDNSYVSNGLNDSYNEFEFIRCPQIDVDWKAV